VACDVALICGNGATSLIIANALQARFGRVPILLEGKESRTLMLRRRIKRLGLMEVLGQSAFLVVIPPILRKLSGSRLKEILRSKGLSLDRQVLGNATTVDSVNSMAAITWLKSKAPRVVVVNGTRILSQEVLSATEAVFINTHCGITPEYRGTHGGYWARVTGDWTGCGVTVHLVDQGIDTGAILAQHRIEPTKKDNFVTYPYLQVAAAIPSLLRSVEQVLAGEHAPYEREARSQLWYHPTLWAYLINGLRRGIW